MDMNKKLGKVTYTVEQITP